MCEEIICEEYLGTMLRTEIIFVEYLGTILHAKIYWLCCEYLVSFT